MAHITVNDVTPNDQYTATAAQVDFTVSYPYFTDAGLTVYLTPVGSTFNAATDLLTLSTHYTVTGAGNVAGVTRKITLVTPATAGDVVTIVRSEPFERTSDYQNNGDLLAVTLNDEQDLEIMLMQQLKEMIGRGLLQPVGDSGYYDAGSRLIKSMADPVDLQDAATRGWIQDNLSTIVTTIDTPELANTAAMTALSTTNLASTKVYVAAHTTSGDRGAGWFEYLSGSTETVDNGVVYAPDVGPGRWKRVLGGTDVWLEWWGIDITGATGCDTAFQAAIDYLVSIGGGLLRIGPDVTPLLDTATITADGPWIRIVGSGANGNTRINVSHVAGPAFRFKREHWGIVDCDIYATGSRVGGAKGSGTSINCGILLESDDEASADLVRFGICKGVVGRHHPGGGLILSAAAGPNVIDQCDFKDNASHGIALDNGTITGRTNKNVTSLVVIDNSTVFDNDGHGLLFGEDAENTNRTVRVLCRNTEFGRNAESAGDRKSADQVHGFGSEIRFIGCAFQGTDQAKTVATTGGIEVAGTDIHIEACRFLDVTGHAINIESHAEFATSGVWVKGFQMSEEIGQPTLDPAILIDTVAENVYVEKASAYKMDSIVPVGRRSLRLTPEVVVKGATQSVTSSTTLVDDDELKVALLANQRSAFRATIIYDGDAAGDIKVGFTIPSGAQISWGPAGGTLVNTSDAVAIQNAVTASGNSVSLGCAGASTYRVLEIVGQVKTNGTAGDLQLQFAQVTSNGTASRISGESSLTIYAP